MNEEAENCIEAVRNFYDTGAEYEWGRLERHPFEFELTTRMMQKYVKPGDSVLDIGGGPGRYSLHFAEAGCDVTLADLSEGCVAHAKREAEARGLRINAVACDARTVDQVLTGRFDHVFLMGPMYHLLDEADRVRAVEAAMNLLKPGGCLYVSFIAMIAGVIYYQKFAPEAISAEHEQEFIECLLAGRSYGGDAFTKAYFISQNEILPFLDRFKLEKLHLFGQEGIMALHEAKFLEQSAETRACWLELAHKLCDREELLSHSEHIMYIGRKL